MAEGVGAKAQATAQALGVLGEAQDRLTGITKTLLSDYAELGNELFNLHKGTGLFSTDVVQTNAEVEKLSRTVRESSVVALQKLRNAFEINRSSMAMSREDVKKTSEAFAQIYRTADQFMSVSAKYQQFASANAEVAKSMREGQIGAAGMSAVIREFGPEVAGAVANLNEFNQVGSETGLHFNRAQRDIEAYSASITNMSVEVGGKIAKITEAVPEFLTRKAQTIAAFTSLTSDVASRLGPILNIFGVGGVGGVGGGGGPSGLPSLPGGSGGRPALPGPSAGGGFFSKAAGAVSRYALPVAGISAAVAGGSSLLNQLGIGPRTIMQDMGISPMLAGTMGTTEVGRIKAAMGSRSAGEQALKITQQEAMTYREIGQMTESILSNRKQLVSADQSMLEFATKRLIPEAQFGAILQASARDAEELTNTVARLGEYIRLLQSGPDAGKIETRLEVQRLKMLQIQATDQAITINTQRAISAQERKIKYLEYEYRILELQKDAYSAMHAFPERAAIATAKQVQLRMQEVAAINQSLANAKELKLTDDQIMQLDIRRRELQTSSLQLVDQQRRTYEEIFTTQALNLASGTYMQNLGASGYAAQGPSFMAGRGMQTGAGIGTRQTFEQVQFGPFGGQRALFEQRLLDTLRNQNVTIRGGSIEVRANGLWDMNASASASSGVMSNPLVGR